ncbi:MBD domain-containing protein [Abeliophyllum distichum]|uniref:MBD domain-containing protein n=1 Tax=Abeliophyllum distichum TaxID=126358 RepID=A0ABD1TE85_9LAMI
MIQATQFYPTLCWNPAPSLTPTKTRLNRRRRQTSSVNQFPKGEQGSGSGIASEPISVAAPADGSAGPTRPPMKRNLEEMAKRPDWLPENWTIDLRVRSSGATRWKHRSGISCSL